jgi:hydrogenase expression/formation protein HypE
VNDLAVSGAIPLYLSAGFIIEEGFSIEQLDQIAGSMAMEAKKAGVTIVAGDTKVVKRGQCDKLFINTAGVGRIVKERMHLYKAASIKAGDKILVTGNLGDHAIAVLAAREDLSLDEEILSDAAALNSLTEQAMQKPEQVCQMRDITRGGLATVLNEVCDRKDFGMHICEDKLPVRRSVRSICELYGFDPLYLANEGKIMMIVKEGAEDEILSRIRKHDKAKEAVIIGEITSDHPGKVTLRSSIGGLRNIDVLSGEMLPRIC